MNPMMPKAKNELRNHCKNDDYAENLMCRLKVFGLQNMLGEFFHRARGTHPIVHGRNINS